MPPYLVKGRRNVPVCVTEGVPVQRGSLLVWVPQRRWFALPRRKCPADGAERDCHIGLQGVEVLTQAKECRRPEKPEMAGTHCWLLPDPSTLVLVQ